jgi:hypothetical protein
MRKTMANIMFNAGMIGAMFCLLVALAGYAMGGR